MKINSLYVGTPNVGDRKALLTRINDMLDRRWLPSNDPLVKEYEEKACEDLSGLNT